MELLGLYEACSTIVTVNFDVIALQDPCVPNPCKHSGHCEAVGRTVECECRRGYTGKTCLNRGKIYANNYVKLDQSHTRMHADRHARVVLSSCKQ